jgi:hypothetical protein
VVVTWVGALIVLSLPAQVHFESVHPGSHVCLRDSVHSTASSNGSASTRLGRHCASRLRTIRPARSSTLRSREMAGRLTANASASSLTVASLSARQSGSSGASDRRARRSDPVT